MPRAGEFPPRRRPAISNRAAAWATSAHSWPKPQAIGCNLQTSRRHHWSGDPRYVQGALLFGGSVTSPGNRVVGTSQAVAARSVVRHLAALTRGRRWVSIERPHARLRCRPPRIRRGCARPRRSVLLLECGEPSPNCHPRWWFDRPSGPISRIFSALRLAWGAPWFQYGSNFSADSVRPEKQKGPHLRAFRSSGGGIRTRDLRVMRSLDPVRPRPEPWCESRSGAGR